MFPIQDTVPGRNPPITTWAIILANCGIFLLEISLPEQGLHQLFYLFGIVPARYTHPEWAAYVGFPVDNYWPFLTSIFLHGSWFHILANMWTLWIFGNNVEDRMGPLGFLLFYLLCGIGAGVVHLATNPASTVPTVGASGAIAGVMGAYFILFPYSRLIIVVPIFFWPFFLEIPAVSYLLIWFLIQLFSGTAALATPAQVGGIAWWAHIGGFLCGLLTFALFIKTHRPRRRFESDEKAFEDAWIPHK
ncbi:MAG: rhomboid family intramembrane serine protease [Pirellulales bacterium]|nr:rhomboid family intramembrane serine protease [Pirellulales bacterium]